MELTEGVEFLWNDVACLFDARCSFVICKTMLQLPMQLEEMKTLEKLEVKEITKGFQREEQDTLMVEGEITIVVTYESIEELLQQIVVSIPYSGEYHGTLERGNTPEVSYAYGQIVGEGNLLIETVLAIPNGDSLMRTNSVVLGEFYLKETVVLPEDWPEYHQVVGTQVIYQIEDYEVNHEGVLNMIGLQQLGILYAGNNTKGEKIILHQEVRPLVVQMPLAHPIVEFGQLEIGYRTLITQIIGPQQVQVSGYCVVRANEEQQHRQEEAGVVLLQRQEWLQPSQSTAVVAEDGMEKQEDDLMLEQIKEKETPTVFFDSQSSMTGNGKNGVKKRSSTGRKRTSRRDNMSKHMRNLDRGVRTAKAVKKFGIDKNTI